MNRVKALVKVSCAHYSCGRTETMTAEVVIRNTYNIDDEPNGSEIDYNIDFPESWVMSKGMMGMVCAVCAEDPVLVGPKKRGILQKRG